MYTALLPCHCSLVVAQESLHSLIITLLAGCLCTVFCKVFSSESINLDIIFVLCCRHGVEVGCEYAQVADMLNSKSSTNEAAVAP